MVEVREFKQVPEEDARLKGIVAGMTLKKAILQDALPESPISFANRYSKSVAGRCSNRVKSSTHPEIGVLDHPFVLFPLLQFLFC